MRATQDDPGATIPSNSATIAISSLTREQNDDKFYIVIKWLKENDLHDMDAIETSKKKQAISFHERQLRRIQERKTR